MKVLCFIVLLVSTAFGAYCAEPENLSARLLNFIEHKQFNSRQNDVSNLLGKPTQIDEGGKKDIWLYNSDKVNLTIYWNNREDKIEKMVYTTEPGRQPEWDNAKARCLKMGETSIEQVIKTWGMPKDMMIKPVNQQLHYTFHYNTLHLFFRKGRLVNYTLF
jgi:hypothetical protein